MFSPFWKLTRWGFLWPLWGRGCDEWHCKSIYLTIPLVGWFVIFYERDFNRRGEEHLHAYGPEGFEGVDHTFDGCEICIEIKEEMLKFRDESSPG